MKVVSMIMEKFIERRRGNVGSIAFRRRPLKMLEVLNLRILI